MKHVLKCHCHIESATYCSSRRKTKRGAVGSTSMEMLDARTLLSSTYTAANSVSVVTLKHAQFTLYDVDVFLDANTTPTTTLSPNSTDDSITVIGQKDGFKLVDTVVASVKPTGGVKFHLVSASNGVLEVDAGDGTQLDG